MRWTGLGVHGRYSVSGNREPRAALLRKVGRETQALGMQVRRPEQKGMDSSWAAGSAACSSGWASESRGSSPDRGGAGRRVEDARVPGQVEAACHLCSRLFAHFGPTSLAGVCQEPGRGQPCLQQKQKPTPNILLDLINFI